MEKALIYLQKFFLNYFWFGIVLVLISLIWDQGVDKHTFLGNVFIEFIKTIGISILIASIFTFASGTTEFLNKITKLLRDIVIDRNFLGNIDSESKRSALAAIIKPSELQKTLYSDIGRYYDTYIAHTMSIADKCVRSDYSVLTIVKRDEATTHVISESYVTYRLHPTVNGYKDIRVRLDHIDRGPKIKKIRVTAPDGKQLYNNSPSTEEKDFRGNKSGSVNVPLKELGNSYDHLKVELEVIECGHDHWILITFEALEPTDGFRYRIECRDELQVKEHTAFVHGGEFVIDHPEPTQLIFSCDQWINEGTGLAIVVSSTTL